MDKTGVRKESKKNKQTNKVIDTAVITAVVLSSNICSEISPRCWSLGYSRNSLVFRTRLFISVSQEVIYGLFLTSVETTPSRFTLLL